MMETMTTWMNLLNHGQQKKQEFWQNIQHQRSFPSQQAFFQQVTKKKVITVFLNLRSITFIFITFFCLCIIKYFVREVQSFLHG